MEIIEEEAFYERTSLGRIKLLGVRVIEQAAFYACIALENVEFGDKLESIGEHAFAGTDLRHIKLPKVRIIGNHAFFDCDQLTDVDFSEDLERIENKAFDDCPRVRRIAIPLKDEIVEYEAFDDCRNLSQVDLVGGVHKTISSLLLERWRNEMNNEIDRINQVLPNTETEDKTGVIQRWMHRVIRRIEHYKSEHYRLLKEFTTLLELALWKVQLDEEFGEALSKEDANTAKKARIDVKAVRQEQRITSGASVVIKNVLPFLKLE